MTGQQEEVRAPRGESAPLHAPLDPLATGDRPRKMHQGHLRTNLRTGPALVAQWIEHRSPKPCAQVRFLPGALSSVRFP